MTGLAFEYREKTPPIESREMSNYPKNCDVCGRRIVMVDRGKHWVALEENYGGIHRQRRARHTLQRVAFCELSGPYRAHFRRRSFSTQRDVVAQLEAQRFDNPVGALHRYPMVIVSLVARHL